MEKYKKGFTVDDGEPWTTEDWIYSGKDSNNDVIVFLGYDANLYPMPLLSTRPSTEYNRKHFERIKTIALDLTTGFSGEVWLDDVKIKDKKDEGR